MNSRTKEQRLWSQQRYRHQDTKREGKVYRLDQWYPTIERLQAIRTARYTVYLR